MKSRLAKNIVVVALTIALILALSSAAIAAGSPKYIYYVNQSDELVLADYKQAVDELILGDPRLRNAIRLRLINALQNFRAVYVEDEDGTVVDYAKAAEDGLNYPEAYADFAYHVGARSPVKQLIINASGDPEEVPISIVVVQSVTAVNRTTIQATLATGTDPDEAEDESNYTVTVGGTAVPVTAAAYNSVTRVATLTVNLTGLSGACVVNGVTAAVDVPPLPVFSSITTVPGSFKVVLNFNTKVYDLNDNLLVTNFSVTTDGNPNVVTAIEVADSVGAAESTITLTLTSPTIGNTVTEVAVTAAGAAKIGNIWGEATTAATRWQLTPEDTVAPLFTGVRAVEGGYTIYLDFSEAVHTGGIALSASTAVDQDVRVTVNGVRVAAQGNTVAGIAVLDATDSIKVDLDLDTDNLLKAGDSISVTLDARLQDGTEPNHIRDLSNNVFEGLRTRSAVFVAGAGLKNADASTLLYNGDLDLDLSVTLDGALAATKTITVYLEDLNSNGFNFTNGAVGVTGSTGAAEIVGNNKVVFTAPAAGVADNTTLTFTIKQGAAAGRYVFTGVQAVNNSPHDIVFQRSDVGTIAKTEVVVIEGFSSFSAVNLVSAEDNQPFNFQFNIEGALAAGKKIEIDLSELALKVDFSAVNVTETSGVSLVGAQTITASPHTLTKSGDKLILTAGAGGIATGTTVAIDLRDGTTSANIINVASGAAGQHNLILTRDDSGASAPFKVTILGNILDVTATSLDNLNAGQFQIFTFKLDGGLAFNQTATLTIKDSVIAGKIKYGLEPTWTVPAGNGAVTAIVNEDNAAADVVVTFRASENIPSGTVVTINASGVDTTAAPINTLVEVEIARQDTAPAQSDSATFEIGNHTPLAISTLGIESNNADPSLAKAGDTITVTLVTNNIIADVSPTGGATNKQVIMPGDADSVNAFNVVGAPGTTVDITLLVDAADTDGLTTFAFTITDTSGETMDVTEADITDGSSVTVDTTAPVIDAVALNLVAGDGGQAVNSDTLVITFSEAMHADLKVAITGNIVTTVADNKVAIAGLADLNVAPTGITIATTDDRTGNTITSDVVWSAGDTIVTFTFTNVAQDGGAGGVVTYTKVAADMQVGNINAAAKDLAGNQLDNVDIPAANISVN